MHNHIRRVAVLVAVVFAGYLCATTDAFSQSALECARISVSQLNQVKADSCYAEALKQSPKDRVILAEAGDTKMELDRYAEARDLYLRAYDLDSKTPEFSRKLGLAYSALGDHPAAIEALQRAYKLENSLDNSMALGRAYIACGKDSLNRAELVIMRARERDKKAWQPYVALGDLYFAKDIFELSKTQYEEALKIDSLLIEPRVKLGRSYRELARRESDPATANDYYTKALVEFNKVTGLEPKNSRAWFEQGQILMLAKQYLKAGLSFQTYVTLRPDDPRGDIMLARAAYEGSYYSISASPLERILSRTDSLSKAFAPQARLMIAKAYYARSTIKDLSADSVKLMLVKAREAYTALPDSALDNEGRRAYASTIMSLGGDTLKAFALYRRVLEVQYDCNLGYNLGVLYYRQKSYNDVVDVFTKYLASCPDAPKSIPYLYIGLSHHTMKHTDKAIEALNNSALADSTNAKAYYWLMTVYAMNKQMKEATGVARTMEKLGFAKTSPSDMAVGYYLLGKERFDAKDDKGAIAEFNRATDLNPTEATYLLTAISYHRLKDTVNACKYYKLCLKINPRNTDALNNIKKLPGC